jgi:hypothetical protein
LPRGGLAIRPCPPMRAIVFAAIGGREVTGKFGKVLLAL